jgi:hypothetical protein
VGVLARAVFRTVLSEVGNGVFQEGDIVKELTDTNVAVPAQEPTNFTCFVTVIYVGFFTSTITKLSCPTNGASVVLLRQESLILLGGNPKPGIQVILTLLFGSISKFFNFTLARATSCHFTGGTISSFFVMKFLEGFSVSAASTSFVHRKTSATILATEVECKFKSADHRSAESHRS